MRSSLCSPNVDIREPTRTPAFRWGRDIYAAYEELKAKGVHFPQAPEKQPWGGVQAMFADQDGNIYMLQDGLMP